MPGSTVDAGVDTRSASATLTISDMADGVYSVRARAVSVAGLHAADSGRSFLDHQDRHDGAATSRQPARRSRAQRLTGRTTLVATATDSLSGIAGAPAGSPVTTGGYIAYSIDGAAEISALAAGHLPPDGG